jgi:hypothetical protein
VGEQPSPQDACRGSDRHADGHSREDATRPASPGDLDSVDRRPRQAPRNLAVRGPEEEVVVAHGDDDPFELGALRQLPERETDTLAESDDAGTRLRLGGVERWRGGEGEDQDQWHFVDFLRPEGPTRPPPGSLGNCEDPPKVFQARNRRDS